jgi:hypothetical protein
MITVIPDVHGRSFWKEVNEKDEKIVFLGDYIDPYPAEEISRSEALANFEEILELKKKYPDKVVLLIGNHDWQYIAQTNTRSRYDWENDKYIRNLYNDNKDLFNLYYVQDDYLFSHAGISTRWLNGRKLEDLDLYTYGLTDVGYERWGDCPYGSMLWRDVMEGSELLPGYYHVFGHTQLRDPYITDKFACLDCRKIFTIDGKDISYYNK